MTASRWQAIEAMLGRFERAGRQARFWLRDDDATVPTKALDQLIDLCETYSIPLLLAVIPEPATAALAACVRAHPLVQACQHGFNHWNHAREGARACELGTDRPLQIVLGDLARGATRLSELFSEELRHVLVPPWNRIDQSVRAHLPSLGFRAISTFGRSSQAAVAGLKEINAHLDIINWRKGRVGRDHDDLIGKLLAELELALVKDEPIGVLGHHLVHDTTAWEFLATLFMLSASHPAACWISVDEMLV